MVSLLDTCCDLALLVYLTVHLTVELNIKKLCPFFLNRHTYQSRPVNFDLCQAIPALPVI